MRKRDRVWIRESITGMRGTVERVDGNKVFVLIDTQPSDGAMPFDTDDLDLIRAGIITAEDISIKVDEGDIWDIRYILIPQGSRIEEIDGKIIITKEV